MNRWLCDMREGARILASREFWRAFADHWSPRNVTYRMDLWVSRRREQTGQEPDWDVERRIAKRRAEEQNTGDKP